MRENNEGLVQGVLKKGANGTVTLVGNDKLKKSSSFLWNLIIVLPIKVEKWETKSNEKMTSNREGIRYHTLWITK